MIVDILNGRDEKKYGEMIGKSYNFFESLKEKISSLLSSEDEPRWKRGKIGETSYE